jgi:hypothetical protein
MRKTICTAIIMVMLAPTVALAKRPATDKDERTGRIVRGYSDSRQLAMEFQYPNDKTRRATRVRAGSCDADGKCHFDGPWQDLAGYIPPTTADVGKCDMMVYYNEAPSPVDPAEPVLGGDSKPESMQKSRADKPLEKCGDTWGDFTVDVYGYVQTTVVWEGNYTAQQPTWQQLQDMRQACLKEKLDECQRNYEDGNVYCLGLALLWGPWGVAVAAVCGGAMLLGYRACQDTANKTC